MGDIRQILWDYVVENFLFGDKGDLNEETSFLESGIVDSTGILELVAFVEEKFGIKVEDDELVPENLDSIANVVAYLKRKTGEKQTG